jgi:hypothetical protein
MTTMNMNDEQQILHDSQWFWANCLDSCKHWLKYCISAVVILGSPYLIPSPWGHLIGMVVNALWMSLGLLGFWMVMVWFGVPVRSQWGRSLLIKVGRVAGTRWLFPMLPPYRHGYAYCYWRQTEESPKEWGVVFVLDHVFFPAHEAERQRRGIRMVRWAERTKRPHICVIPSPCQVRKTRAEAERDAMAFVMALGPDGNWP